ncbi:cytochrome P450 [Rickenella mellea]|uniref:Cytochrome P450 n=1 Tax=Rickenella mellea TaxID=50990 RepID=A0A4Y7Q904_9AGAM|nr:cytochrome P450 [Rickenella mellea]
MPNMFLAAGFIVVLGWFIARFQAMVNNRKRSDIRYAPGPSAKSASWIWGHELQVFQGQALELYSKWMYTFGPLIKIKAALFHSDLIVVGDHAAVQHIFANIFTYMKSPSLRPLVANTVGEGLVWADGEDHVFQRHLLSPAFTLENVKEMADDISECAEMLESTLTNLVLSNAGAVTLNIVPYTSLCTLDIIGRVAFGHDFKFGESIESREITGAWDHLMNTGLTFGGFLGPIVIRAFPPSVSDSLKYVQSQGRVKAITETLARRIIEDGSQNEKRMNILSVLLKSQGKTGGLSKSQILDNISTFIMAGYETTATALDFALMELARSPGVQQKLRDEVQQSRDANSFGDFQKLKYLDAVTKEILRLFPSVPVTERVAMKDDILPLSTPIRMSNGTLSTSFKVQKGQVLQIPLMTINTNPKVWGEDAGEFRPERWLTPNAMPPSSELPHGWSNMVTFVDGPRLCIGYRIAVFEFKVILATLIRSLEFHSTDATVNRKLVMQNILPVVDGKAGVLPLRITLASHT